MASPTDLQNATNAVSWSNGRGLITGFTLSGMFTLIISIFLSMGTWTNGVYSPNLTAQAIIAGLGFGPAPQVANNAGLSAINPGVFPAAVRRLGFAATGDGGETTYSHSIGKCSLNSGSGDGGAQVPDAAGSGCWNADLSKPISAAVWGVKSDGNPLTDDQPPWLAAITALGTLNNGGTLIVPTRYDVSHLISASSTCSVIGSTLTIGISNVHIIGSGGWGSCFALNFATGNGIEIGGNPTAPTAKSPFNVSVENVGFFNTVPRTSGANVSVFQAQYTQLLGIRCKGPNYWSCIDLDGNNAKTGDGVTAASNNLDTTVRDMWAAYGGQSGIRIGCNPLMTNGVATTSAPVNVILDHLEMDNHAGDAEELCGVGAILQTNINTDFNLHGFHAHPTGGQHISGIFSSLTAYDASAREGFLVDTTQGGYFHENKFNSLWVGGSGTAINPLSVPSRGMSLIGGARLNTIIGNTFDVLVLAAGQDCLVMDGGVIDAELSGELTGCSQSAVGGYHGLFSAGATHWSWRGRIGSYNGAIDTNGNNVLPNYQDYGVYVTDAFVNGNPVQTGDYFTIAGDLSRNHTGPVFINASGTNYSLDGVLPALPWIATTPTLSCPGGTLSTTGQSASMRYQISGKTVRFKGQLVSGTNGACTANLSYTLPLPAFAAGDLVAYGRETSGSKGVTSAATSTTVADTKFGDGTATGANGQTILLNGQYERQ